MHIYDTVDPKYSTLVLKTLAEYLIRLPPYDDHKLLLIATTGKKCSLKKFDLFKLFNDVISLPAITRGPEVISGLEQFDCFPSNDIENLSRQLKNQSLSIGIKQLIDTIKTSKNITNEHRCTMFMDELNKISYKH